MKEDAWVCKMCKERVRKYLDCGFTRWAHSKTTTCSWRSYTLTLGNVEEAEILEF